MTTTTVKPAAPTAKPAATARRRGRSQASALLARGEPMVWLTGGALWICLLMIVGLLGLVLWQGVGTFWPKSVVLIKTHDDRAIQGEITRHDRYELDAAGYRNLHPAIRDVLRAKFTGNAPVPPGRFLPEEKIPEIQAIARKDNAQDLTDFLTALKPVEGYDRFVSVPDGLVSKIAEKHREVVQPLLVDGKAVLDTAVPDDRKLSARRRLVRIGNYELTNEHFVWVSDFEIAEESNPQWAMVMERQAWGRFYGTPAAFQLDGKQVARTAEGAWNRFLEYHEEVRNRWRIRRRLEEHDMGEVNNRREEFRLAAREAELNFGSGSPQHRAAREKFEKIDRWTKTEFERIGKEIEELNKKNARYKLVMRTSGDQETTLALEDIVRAYPANQLEFADKADIYGSRWWEFLSDVPREANSEGGVFPAIFGTAMMTLLMSVAVVPFGVLAALYLREYAKAGPVVSVVRIAINNLAGVPSIVFGVFGLGFFCYGVGSFIDSGPTSAWSPGNWFTGGGVLLGLLAAAVVLGFLLPRRTIGRSGPQKLLGWVVAGLWAAAVAVAVLLVVKTPYFQGFYRARLPNPTFGKGAMIWASMTLALLTLPVVIVATEEALAAVPNSMREGSYACGGSKWQTIQRIVLPRAMPGIMTGTILAMARGAGEVAPLMLVGAVKMAPELPIAASWPFGMDRSFMHLGFHIYDLGFQSQNSEAAKPMVYTTTLLLILMMAALNLTAIWLRGRLRKNFFTSQF